MSALPPVRADLRDFTGYRSARSEPGSGAVWLNANESPWANLADDDGTARRYPEPQPEALQQAFAAHAGCAPEQLLLARGSDEAIDLLVRAFCTPCKDAVLATPPVFGMYAVSARLQGARLLEVPLLDEAGVFCVDLEAVARVAMREGARLVFLCSPGNPAGGVLAADAVAEVARRLSGAALVVIDEAYIDYADTPSILASERPANLAVLRTLSKAHALAGARIGALVADVGVIAALRRCQAPYPVPAPCATLAVAAVSPTSLHRTRAHVQEIREERARMAATLAALPVVRRVYPSQANFLLVRFADADAADAALRAAGIVVRDMRAMPQLGDALRITIGTPGENDAVLAALQGLSGSPE